MLFLNFLHISCQKIRPYQKSVEHIKIPKKRNRPKNHRDFPDNSFVYQPPKNKSRILAAFELSL